MNTYYIHLEKVRPIVCEIKIPDATTKHLNSDIIDAIEKVLTYHGVYVDFSTIDVDSDPYSGLNNLKGSDGEVVKVFVKDNMLLLRVYGNEQTKPIISKADDLNDY